MVIRALIFWLIAATGALSDEVGTLKIIVPEGDLFVGEMIPVTIRGEYGPLMALQKLDDLKAADLDWLQIDRDSWNPERIEGKRRFVFQRRLAVFARKPGEVTLGPVVHRLTLAGARREVDVTSDAVTLTVRPYPGEGKPLAARALTITDELSADPGSLRDGETLIRRVTLTAEAALAHQLPPRPSIRAPWLISFAAPEIRETWPTENGPVSKVVWEWSLRPKTGEPGVLPQIDIPWFDTENRQMQTARIAAIPFGYASFAGNIAGSYGPAAATGWLIALTLVLSSALAAAWILAGRSPVSRARMRGMIGRLVPDRTLAPIDQALARGDLQDLSRRLDAHIRRRQSLGLPAPLAAREMLNRVLFSKSGGKLDPEAFRQRLRTRE